MCVRACVCVCVRVCVPACVRACVRACLPACLCMLSAAYNQVPLSSLPILSGFSILVIQSSVHAFSGQTCGGVCACGGDAGAGSASAFEGQFASCSPTRVCVYSCVCVCVRARASVRVRVRGEWVDGLGVVTARDLLRGLHGAARTRIC